MAADFLFAGALSLGQFSASDENTVRPCTKDDRKRPPRETSTPTARASGSRLTFVDTLAAFIHNNEKIDPAPPAEFFEHGS